MNVFGQFLDTIASSVDNTTAVEGLMQANIDEEGDETLRLAAEALGIELEEKQDDQLTQEDINVLEDIGDNDEDPDDDFFEEGLGEDMSTEDLLTALPTSVYNDIEQDLLDDEDDI